MMNLSFLLRACLKTQPTFPTDLGITVLKVPRAVTLVILDTFTVHFNRATPYAVYAVVVDARACVCVCMSVCHKSVFY